MNKNINVLVGGLAVLLVIFGVSYLKQTKVEVTVSQPETQTYASFPGSDESSPYHSNNGIVSLFRPDNYRPATSTLCVMPTGSATSTLVSFTGIPTTSTSTSVTLVLENRSTPYAPPQGAATGTTAFITSTTIGAGTINPFATSSPSDSATVAVSPGLLLAPNSYLVFWAKYGGAGSIGATVASNVFAGGRCKGVLREI